VIKVGVVCGGFKEKWGGCKESGAPTIIGDPGPFQGYQTCKTVTSQQQTRLGRRQMGNREEKERGTPKGGGGGTKTGGGGKKGFVGCQWVGVRV